MYVYYVMLILLQNWRRLYNTSQFTRLSNALNNNNKLNRPPVFPGSRPTRFNFTFDSCATKSTKSNNQWRLVPENKGAVLGNNGAEAAAEKWLT